MTLNKKMQAVEKAVSMYDKMREACVRADKAINGETLDMYNVLVDWGILERYDISNNEHKFLYVTIIAMQLSREEKQEKPRDDKKGKSRWQIIQDALNKNNNNQISKKK